MAVNDVLHDMGGAGYHVDAYGSLSSLLAAMPSAGGAALLPVGVISVTASLTIDHELVFQEGSILAPASGVTVMLTRKPRAGFYRIFDTTAGGTIQFAWGAVDEVYPEWWGIGTDAQTTAALRAALAAAGSASNSVLTPAGRYVGYGPEVVLRGRSYSIDDEIDYGGAPAIRAPGRAVIEQKTAGKRIFHSAANYVVNARIEGVHFIGGTRQVEFSNPNVDGTTLTLVDCTFDLSTDYAVWTAGRDGITGYTAIGPLKDTVLSGQTANILVEAVNGPATPYLFPDVYVRFRRELSGTDTAEHVARVTAIGQVVSGGKTYNSFTVDQGPPWDVAAGKTLRLGPIATLAASAAGGDRSLVIYSQTGGIQNLKDQPVAIRVASGETHVTAVTKVEFVSGTGWVMSLLHALPSHWTSAQLGGGSAVYGGDIHLSANVSLQRCQFHHCRRVLQNTADSCLVHGDTWVFVHRDAFDADSAAVVNLSGDLHLRGFFGVPEMGTGASRLANTRWIDMAAYGYGLKVSESRFGGEDAGMPVVEFWTPPFPSEPGTWVVIRDSYVAAGPQGAGAVLTLRSQVPQLFVYENNVGPLYVPIVRNGRGTAGTGVTLSTYFGTDPSAVRRFRFVVGPNLDYISGGVDAVPAELRRFADVSGILPLPRGPLAAPLLASPANTARAAFTLPAEVRAFHAIATVSGSVPGVAGSRAARSDLVTVYRTVSGSTITETLAIAQLLAPQGAGAGGLVLAAAFASTGTASRTVPTVENDREVWLTYTGLGGDATVSVEPLHTGT